MSGSRRLSRKLLIWARLFFLAILALGARASAAIQDPAPPQDSGETGSKPPTDANASANSDSDDAAPTRLDRSLIDRIHALFSDDDEPGGPINTDRPTFTPANTVVPWGRLQVETGFTFNNIRSNKAPTYTYDFPELGVRLGIFDRVEFRTFWLGQTYATTRNQPGGPWTSINGPSDMEVGFKTQLFAGDKKRKYLPTTALITSIMAPTGGTSNYSSQTVEPYINLIYGWSATDKLTIAGSTAFLGMRQQAAPGSGGKAEAFQRYSQSLVAFYSATEKTTLFYEWYLYTFTNASDNRPQNYMDAGIIRRLSTNMQVDIRAGLGLSGRPDDFFTGAGFSVRF